MNEEKKDIKGKILIVDDEPSIREYLERVLRTDGYETQMVGNARDALKMLEDEPVDVLLADIHMPGESGLWLLKEIKKRSIDTSPVVVTASHDFDEAVDALNSGAESYLVKPLRMDEVINKIGLVFQKRMLTQENLHYQQNLEEMVERRTQQLLHAREALKESYIEAVYRLTAAAEYRDEDTRAHLKRIGLYARMVAEHMGFSQDESEILHIVGPMHDLGKVGIPDSILLKPGSLTAEEFEVMKNHTVIGAGILQGSSSRFMQIAEEIALCHHEKWDGTGYPRGLKQETIPLVSRILCLADQYDAIRSKRPYKPPIDHPTTFRILTEGDSKSTPEQFDPAVLEAFRKREADFAAIFDEHRRDERDETVA